MGDGKYDVVGDGRLTLADESGDLAVCRATASKCAGEAALGSF